MIKAAMHGAGRSNLNRALSQHLPFRTSGSMRGDLRPTSTGALNSAEKELFLSDWDNITYVVYSYATPIAWIVNEGGTLPRIHIVDQKFSVTTSRQQGTLWMLSH